MVKKKNNVKNLDENVSLNGLERRIINKCKELARHEITNVYDIIQMTEKLIDMELTDVETSDLGDDLGDDLD